MAELQSGKKLFREFFDILAGKGRKLDEAAFKPSTIATLETLAKRAAENQLTGAPITKVEKAALNSFTTDVLDQIKKTNGAITPQSVVQLQEAYSMALTRAFDGAPGGTAALKEFKDSIKSTWAEKYGSTPAKVEGLADKRAEREVAKVAPVAVAPKPTPAPAPVVQAAPPKPRVEVAEEVVDAPTPPPRAAAPTPEADVVDVDVREVKKADAADNAPAAAPAAAKADNAPPVTAVNESDEATASRKAAYDHDFVARERAAQAVKAQDNLVDIRGGMATARTGAAKGLLQFESATTYSEKKDAFTMLVGGKIGDPTAADNPGVNVFFGVRPSGWLVGKNTAYEMASAMSHILTNHVAEDGSDLFANPRYRLALRDYVADGSFDQKVPPIGVEALNEVGAQAKAAEAAGKALTDAQIDAGVDKWIETLKARFKQNEAAGKVVPLDKDGLRTTDSVKALIENREMTPLTFDKSVVQNAPGAWIIPEEWTKLRSSLHGDLQHAHLTKLREDLNKLLPLENTAQFDGEGMRKIFETMKLEVVKVRDFTDKYPDLLTDSAKYELAREDALKAGKSFTQAAPNPRDAMEIRKDLMDGKILSEREITSLQQHFFGNQFKAQSREYARAFNALLGADNTVALNVDGAGGINEQLNKLKPIINQEAYQKFAVRSAEGQKYDQAVEQALANGQPKPVRDVNEIKRDIINGDKVTESELTQATDHYRAVLVLAKSRAEVREMQDLLRFEGTSDLIVDAKHPQASTVGGKGLHERFEELRNLEQIPNYREHYPLSASAQQAATNGTKRTPQEILQDLTTDHRVSRDELFQLEGHFRAGYMRATVAETIEKAVKFSPQSAERGKALQELAEGVKPLDNVIINNQSVPRTLDAALQDVRRRVLNEEAWLRSSGMLPQNQPPGRPIHEIVNDFRSGELSAANLSRLSLEDAKVFADKYRAFVAGEGRVVQNKEIMDRLYTVYESSNGIGKKLRNEDKATLRADFDTLQRNMRDPSYAVFMEDVTRANPEAGKQVRRDMDKILGDMREGLPVHKDELTRVREFYDRWHNADRQPPGRLASLTGARFWDRRLDSLVLGPTASVAAGLGAVTLASGIALGGSSGPTPPSGPGGPGNGGLSLPGGNGSTILGDINQAGNRGLPSGTGIGLDALQAKAAMAVAPSNTAGQILRNHESSLDQQLRKTADYMNEYMGSLQGSATVLNTAEMNTIAAALTASMKPKLESDRVLTLEETATSFKEAMANMPPDIANKVKEPVDKALADLQAKNALKTPALEY